jgi:hypothetical protein
VEPTDEEEQMDLHCSRPEQRDYEEIRSLALFEVSAVGRSRLIDAASERTPYGRTEGFGAQQTS